MEDLDKYMEISQLTDWAKANLDIIKPNNEMSDTDIRQIIRWIGICAIDTIFANGDKPILRRIGIGMMLTATLLAFPEFYNRYELAQFN